jgi:hypothetical protein
MVLSREQDEAEAGHSQQKADQRQRNFTLLMRAYTQVRRAIGYVRFEHGDADRIAPPPPPKAKRRPRGPAVSSHLSQGG